MPFTPYHLGPAILVASLLPGIDALALMAGSLAPDLEPLLVLAGFLPGPLHQLLHSLTGGTILGLFIAAAITRLRRVLQPEAPSPRRVFASALLGVYLHVLLDAPIYSDLALAYPLRWNPLYGLVGLRVIQGVCVALGVLGVGLLLRRRRGSVPRVEEAEADFTPQAVDETWVQPSEVETDSPPQQEVEAYDPPDIVLGDEKLPKQWGIIGSSDGSKVALDLNEPHIVFVCGKQGSGKGYTIGVISEMLLSTSIPGISQVGKPATLIVFHKPREDIKSEFWSIIDPNLNLQEVAKLREQYGVEPRRVVSEKQLRVFIDPFVYQNERKKFQDDYGVQVYPIAINPSRLTAEDWPYVLSIGRKSGSIYVKKIFQIIKKTQYDRDFGLNKIKANVESSDLNPNQKSFAFMRLETLQDYLQGGDFVSNLVLGGVNIFDLRRIMMEPDDIFSVMILVVSSLLNDPRTEMEQFVFVINEAHDYLRKGLSKDFTDYINYLIRKKRHAGTWLMLDTHFPEDVDPKVIKGSDIKIFHKSDVVSSKLLAQIVSGTSVEPHLLETGQAIIRADKSTLGPDRVLVVEVRPRLTHHGGATKRAV